MEHPSSKTVRLAKEAKIKDFYRAGDAVRYDEALDTYPYNKPRAEVSLERAKDIARKAITHRTATARGDTEEIPVITPEMLQ